MTQTLLVGEDFPQYRITNYISSILFYVVFLEDMRGSIAADLKGFVFAVGSDDHPAALLNSDPIAAPLGEITVVKLSLQIVGSIQFGLYMQLN